MEVNEMKGVDDLPFGENPFHRSLNNASMVEIKRHSSHVMKTKMMIRRGGGDHHHHHHHQSHGYGLPDGDDDDGEMSLNDREIIFPTAMISGQAPTCNNNNSNVFSPNTASCYSNDTVLDGSEQLTVMAERKLRRMISNRESARRSRMRKKKQIEELQYQVGQLEGSNRQLSEKLIQLLECNQQILHENAELKRKVSSLQIILTDFLTPLRNLEDAFCNSNRVRAEANSNSSHHLPS